MSTTVYEIAHIEHHWNIYFYFVSLCMSTVVIQNCILTQYRIKGETGFDKYQCSIRMRVIHSALKPERKLTVQVLGTEIELKGFKFGNYVCSVVEREIMRTTVE